MFTLRQNPVAISLHREVAELRRATLQIAEDWEEMTSLMTVVKDQQNSFMRRLDSDFESMSDLLQNSVTTSLEEESTRNEDRFTKIHRIIDGFRADFLGVKEMIQRQGELMEKAKEKNPAALVDGWAQTEFVATKRRQKEGHGKFVDENATENDTSKPIITVIKKALAEFLKEVRKHLSIQREGGIADMRIIFSQISEDREDIKSAIESAFSAASLQTQKNFEQFGLVGREAIKCLAKLNEKSESGMAVRFLEFGDKLRGIFELLKGLNFDVSSIKQTLDNIDGQFDEIYQKLELGCQKNADHSEEISTRLQQTAEEWKQKSSNLEQISKHLGATTDGMKEMLCNLNNLICCKTMDASEMNIQQYAPSKRKASFSTYEEAMLTDKNLAMLNQYTSLEGLGALSAMIQICLSKLNSLKDQIDQGTDGIKQSTDILLEKLNFLTSLVEGSVENLKTLNVQESTGQSNPQQSKLNRDLREFVSSIINMDLNGKIDERKSESSGFAKTVLSTRYLGNVSNDSAFYTRGAESDKTSIITVNVDNAKDGTFRRSKELY